MSYDEVPPDFISSKETGAEKPSSNSRYLDTVIAIYDFAGTQLSHLPFDIGETIHVLTKHESGWWDGVTAGRTGDLSRGWFPLTYVRLVNYVQPVLDKLLSNKEIDSITAANTAANVLMPTFKLLLQKNLTETSKDWLAGTTRKSSVVSFASLDGSLPELPAKKETKAGSLSDSQLLKGSVHQPSFASTVSGAASYVESSDSKFLAPHTDSVKLMPVEEAEQILAEIKKTQERNYVWLPRMTEDGDIIFYCEVLDIYCEELPLAPVTLSVELAGGNLQMPSQFAIDDVSIVRLNGDLGSPHLDPLLRSSLSISKSLEGVKRDLNASTMTLNSASSYHHFDQPFFAAPDLFYEHYSDCRRWSELLSHFDSVLDLTSKSLAEYHKQLFHVNLARLNKVVNIAFFGTRLAQNDFVGTKYEKPVRRRLRKLSSSFAQVHINGLLHLSSMHYAQDSTSSQLFSMNMRGLNKLTNVPSSNNHSVSSYDSTSTHRASVSALRSNPPEEEMYTVSTGKESDVYLHQVEIDVRAMRSSFHKLINMLRRLTEDKKIRMRDYDSSEASEDEGINRYDLLPQVYPRLISKEFNGGNWCNPFFPSHHKYLNVSGEQLKVKHHSKTIIDHVALEQATGYVDDLSRLSKDAIAFLDVERPEKYYSETLRSERNEQVIRLMYKILHHSSSLIDLLESLDFTLFCLVKKYSSLDGGRKKSKPELENEEIRVASGALTFDYPIVLDFFQFKQQLHDNIARIVLSAQALTLEDQDVFVPMKSEMARIQDREAMKDEMVKSSMLLLGILSEQGKRSIIDRLLVRPEMDLNDVLYENLAFCGDLLDVVRQLVDERETILNYATRVMHDDLNVELLVIERNNTISNLKVDDGAGEYFGGKAQDDDIPWYLEGDEEFDLLLDINGNVKGGTKEALVAHLTHHDHFDGTFNSSFLQSFATIMSLGELTQFLISRFNIEAPEGLSYEEYLSWRELKQNRVRMKVINIMKLILEDYWCDSYFNEHLLKNWLSFLRLPVVQVYPIYSTLIEDITTILGGHHVHPERKPEIPDGKAPAPILKGFSLRKIKLFDIDYIELARQLTIREFHDFCGITKEACIHKVWGKKSGLKEDVSKISNFIKALNQLTNFVAFMILRKEDPRKRVQIIRYFVNVAEKCRLYNNFSSMTAIISALYSSPIHRLKKTWAYISRETLNQLQGMNKLMNSSRNFNEYRDMLRFIGLEACVPFFGVFLSDLTFIYHGNTDFLLNRARMVNFSKRTKTVEITAGIDRFKKTGYNFTRVEEVQSYLDLWLKKCPPIDEQYQISLKLEPREQDDLRHVSLVGQRSLLNATVKGKQPANILGLR